MSLDFWLTKPVIEVKDVFGINITHNLTKMADEAGIYNALWHPEEIRATKARHVIHLLEDGLYRLKSNPEHYLKLNPPNGWGSYEGFIDAVEKILMACKEHPDAEINVSR